MGKIRCLKSPVWEKSGVGIVRVGKVSVGRVHLPIPDRQPFGSSHTKCRNYFLLEKRRNVYIAKYPSVSLTEVEGYVEEAGHSRQFRGDANSKYICFVCNISLPADRIYIELVYKKNLHHLLNKPYKNFKIALKQYFPILMTSSD